MAKEWTFYEIGYLRRKFPTTPNKVLAEELGRTEQAVIKKASLLGITKSGYFVDWTPRRLKMLQEFYPTMFSKDLAKLLGVSHTSLLRKAKELGLKKIDGFLEKKRKAINERSGPKLPHRGQFKKGNPIGAEYRYTSNQVDTEEIKQKRIASIKEAWRRKRLLAGIEVNEKRIKSIINKK